MGSWQTLVGSFMFTRYKTLSLTRRNGIRTKDGSFFVVVRVSNIFGKSWVSSKVFDHGVCMRIMDLL